VSESNTVPEKWFSAETVRADMLDAPAFAVTREVVVIVKSRNWNVAVALWISGVLAPLIVAV